MTIGAMIQQVRKDTRNKRGPLKKTKSVLAHRYPGGSLNNHMLIFQEQRGDQIPTRAILIERDVIHDMGNPDIVTVTIEPGDTIN
jgi:pyruvate/oxaloacetate carboxyltransferase